MGRYGRRGRHRGSRATWPRQSTWPPRKRARISRGVIVAAVLAVIVFAVAGVLLLAL